LFGSLLESTSEDYFKMERSLFNAFLGVNLFTNFLLTGLIGKSGRLQKTISLYDFDVAGRLWWISHITQEYLGHDPSNGKRMHNIVAMMFVP
jgi:hypothetical protein